MVARTPVRTHRDRDCDPRAKTRAKGSDLSSTSWVGIEEASQVRPQYRLSVSSLWGGTYLKVNTIQFIPARVWLNTFNQRPSISERLGLRWEYITPLISSSVLPLHLPLDLEH